jgi:hypothetical protein
VLLECVSLVGCCVVSSDIVIVTVILLWQMGSDDDINILRRKGFTLQLG